MTGVEYWKQYGINREAECDALSARVAELEGQRDASMDLAVRSFEQGRLQGLDEAKEAVVAEYLEGDTEDPEDRAYDRGIADAVTAIEAIKETGQ